MPPPEEKTLAQIFYGDTSPSGPSGARPLSGPPDGSSSSGEDRPSTAQVLYGGPTPSRSSVKAGAEEKSTAEVMYGNPGGSEACPGAIDSALSGTFRSWEEQARGGGDHEHAATLGGIRAHLAGAMGQLGFSAAAARELSGLISDYGTNPREPEVMEKNFEEALDALHREFGDELPAVFEGINKVIHVLTKKHDPLLLDYLHGTGLSRDKNFLRLCANIAKSRGMVPKK